MKVATKLSGAFGLHVVILVGLLVYHVRTIHEMVSTSYELSDISSRLSVGSTAQRSRLDELEENAGKYWVTRDPGYLAKFNETLSAFDAALRQLGSRRLSDQERREVARLSQEWARFRPMAERLHSLVGEASTEAARDSLDALHDHLDRLRLQAHNVSEASQSVMAARLESSTDAARAAERISWSAAAGALLLSVLVSGLIVRSISESLGRLKEGTREVARGNFAYRLGARREDEFAQLSRDFNTMVRRLGELDQMKRDFVSKVSHDLKTPLASMQETVNLLLDEVPGKLTERQRRLLDLNLLSGQRLSSMIAKVLDLSGLEAGALTPRFGMADLVSLVRATLDQTEPTIAERRVRLAADLPDAPLPVECDADLVVRVLGNLLENAGKFSPEGGVVRVALRLLSERPEEVPPQRWRTARPPGSAAPGIVLLSVADSGPGIPDAEKERVFERFFQSETGRKARGRGVGLGLTICREIVAAHRGAIWVCDNPDGGSVFHVLLPVALPGPAQAASAASIGPEPERT